MMKSKAEVKKSKVLVKKPEVRPIVTDHNLRVLKELKSGKYLSARITDENGKQLSEALGVSGRSIPRRGVYSMIRKLEDMGIIVGYIPLLSEEGRRIVDALELMYGLKKGNHEALVDIMGQENP